MTNETYIRVPLAVFEKMADVLSDIDWAQANLTTAYSIKQKVAEGHALIEKTLGKHASAIYAEET